MSKRRFIYITTLTILTLLLVVPATSAQTPPDFWGLQGNSGTTAGTHFIGTTDNEALELHVNGSRTLRLEPAGRGGGVPNIIGGFTNNSAKNGVAGAVIAGGGDASGAKNSVVDSFGTVSGGSNNKAGGGGQSTSDAQYAVVGGGSGNKASGAYSTIPGGSDNKAHGDYSFAAGRRAKAEHEGSFVWGDSTDAGFSSTGANQFLVRASGGVGIGTDSPSHTLEVGGDAKVLDLITGGPWVDVRAHGAVCDGIADDTSAFSQAASSIPQGGAIFVPPGNCQVTVFNINSDDVKVFGIGSASKITNISASAANVITVAGDNVLIQDLNLISNGVDAASGGGLGNGILFNGTTGGKAVRNYISGHPKNGSGIQVLNAEETTLTDNLIKDGLNQSTDIKIKGDSHKTLVSENTLLSANRAGVILLSATDTQSISQTRIFSNYIANKTDAIAPGVAHCIVAINELPVRGKIGKLIIQGNHCKNIDGIGVYVATEADEAIIANNMLESVVEAGTGGTLADGAITFGNFLGISDAIIQGNMILGGGVGGGLGACVRLVNADDVSIIGNDCKDFQGVGMRLYGDRTIVSSNQISGSTSIGIWLTEGDDVNISHNVVSNLMSTSTAYRIDALTDRTTVSHNKAHTTLAGTAYNFQGPSIFAIDNQQTGFTTPVGIGVGANVFGLATPDPQDLSGQITLNGNVVTVGYTFNTPQPNADYNVVATPVSVSAGAASGSSRVRSVSKNLASFSITVEAPPGAGESVTFDWQLMR